MDQTLKKPAYVKSLLIGFAGIFSAVVPFMLGAAPGFFAHLFYTGGIRHFLLAFTISTAGSLALLGSSALYAQAVILAAAMLIGLMLKRKAAYFDIALYAAALVTCLLFLSVSLNDLISGAPTFHWIQTQLKAVFDVMGSLLRESVAAGLTTDEAARAFTAYGNSLVATLPVFMPATLCSFGALFGLFNLLVAVKLNRRAHAPMKPMSKFILWRLPKSFVSGALVMAAGAFAAVLIGVTPPDAVIPAVMTVVTIPLAVQGLCLCVFLKRMRRARSSLIVLIVLLFLIAPDTAQIALAAAGLIEQLFHMRRRIIQGSADKNE